MFQYINKPYVTVKCQIRNRCMESRFIVVVADSENNIIFCGDTNRNNEVSFSVSRFGAYKIKAVSMQGMFPNAICKCVQLNPNVNTNVCFEFRACNTDCCSRRCIYLTDYHYYGLPIQQAQIFLRRRVFMASPYVINITNGVGSEAILNGTYDVTAAVTGYDDTSILPITENIVAGVDTYDFTIASTGTLTLHVTEDGTAGGTPVAGAVFARCDSAGNVYGAPVTSDVNGDAVFDFVPFAASGAPLIYFKQTASDGNHEFNPALDNTTMTTATQTLEILNAPAATRNIGLTDANYAGLPLATGSLTLTTA